MCWLYGEMEVCKVGVWYICVAMCICILYSQKCIEFMLYSSCECDGIYVENESGINLIEWRKIAYGRVVYLTWEWNGLSLFRVLECCCNAWYVNEVRMI